MMTPSMVFRATVAFACLLLLNSAASFAQQPAPSDLDKAIQNAEDEIQELEKFIQGPSISPSLRASLEPVLKSRQGRRDDLKKLRELPVKLSSGELQNVIASLNGAPAGAPDNDRREDPQQPPALDDKSLSQRSNVISGGGAKPGAQVEVLVNDKLSWKTTSSAEGNFNLNVPDLVPGDRVKVRQTYTTKDNESVTSFFSNEKTIEPLAPNRGAPVGYLIGGIVMSQQSREFSQADPFFGFVGGYRFGRFERKNSQGLKVDDLGNLIDDDGYRVKECEEKTLQDKMEKCFKLKSEGDLYQRMIDKYGEPVRSDPSHKQANPFKRGQWNVLFQGVFQTDARVASEKDFANAPSFDPFIVSRKTFNIETQLWWDFKISRNVRLGPYGAWGGSTVLSKNETQGETTSVVGADRPINIGEDAKIDNDMKQYKEYGMRMNVSLLNKNVYLQSILARGNYEALKGLAPNVDSTGKFTGHHNTQHRFIGKLMIVPMGLGNMFGEQRDFTPMFGVEVNAGYGPDQLKFFFGSIIRVKGLTNALKD
jgi:hypothetical protein